MQKTNTMIAKIVHNHLVFEKKFPFIEQYEGWILISCVQYSHQVKIEQNTITVW